VITNFKIRGGSIVCSAVLLLLSGCQTFSGIKAKIADLGRPQPTSVLTEAEFTADVKPAQKADVQMAVARALEGQGDTEQAIKTYQEVVKLNGRRADAYQRLAILHDMKGDVAAAQKYYQMALKRAPKNSELYCDVGYSCYLRRNWAEAEKHLRRAIALNPQFGRAHTNLGLVLARTGRDGEALAEFAKAGCDEATGRCNLAFALKLEQRWADARQQYDRALAVYPRSQAAKEGLATMPPETIVNRPVENVNPAPAQFAGGNPPPAASDKPPQTASAKIKAETPMVQATYQTAIAPENLRGGCLVR
jgi:tetratricopeptide (TPR) repeat protein